MTASRTWNLRLNLDEFNSLVASLYTDADRALVLQGMSLGLNGGDLPDGAPPSFLRGWEMGHGMRTEAERFRDVQSERGRSSAEKRRERNGSAQPIKPGQSRTEPEPPFEPVFEPPLEPPVEPNHNPQSTILKTTNDKPIPPTPQRGNRAARATAPTEDEWVAYCTKTWPDWHPICAAESWAYYQAKGWRIGSVPVRDWQAAARTSHGNARQWGKLQPVSGDVRAATGRAGPATARRPAGQALIDQLRNQRGTDATNPNDPATATESPVLTGAARAAWQRAIAKTAPR